MGGLNRRFMLGAIALPLLFLATSGLARANDIIVNTLDGGSDAAPLCTLEDAVTAANSHTAVNGCATGTGDDIITFSVTGTIFTHNTLFLSDASLSIIGPNLGTPAGPPPPAGIAIDGGGTHEILETENSTTTLENLTFTHGNITSVNYLPVFHAGGAILAEGDELFVFNCNFNNNFATGVNGLGGAILADNGGFVEIENSTFVGNQANFGGAIWNSNDTVFLNNLTFSGNEAGLSGFGGSIGYASTFGVHTFLRGSILANSATGGCEEPPELLEDDGYNLSDDNSCSFSFLSGTSSSNVANLNLDPAGLQNNGGPTETIALESGSKAIGFDKNCVDLEDVVVSNDQRLFGRPNSPTSCSSGAYEFGGRAPLMLNSERLQIARSSSPGSDQVKMALTYTDSGPGTSGPACDSGNNGLNGVAVSLFQGTCAALPGLELPLDLEPFSVHTVSGQSYGTFAGTSPGNVVARIVQLTKPAGTCGKWTLDIEDAAIATATYGLTGGSGPGTTYAVVIADEDGNAGCFDITDAIVGSQTPTPPRKVRRGVRR